MRAIVMRELTGEVLVEFEGYQLVDAMDATSFFKMQKEEAESKWDNLWRGVRGGELARITPRKDDSYDIQVRNEFIHWEV